MSKYHNIPTVVDNITFHSKKEAQRYGELKLLFKSGKIRNLELQPKIPVRINYSNVFTYIADFAYFEDGRRVFEDVKGMKTPVYRLKKKIVEALYNIEIREI